MKTKIKNVSRRALALVLCFLMMFSTLMVGTISTANAVDHTGGYIYFLKPSTWTETYVMMFIGHSSYTSVYSMTKVSNTNNLYRYTMPSWSGATYVAFANGSSAWGSGSWGSSNRTNAAHYTNVYNNYGFNSGSYYVCVPASTSNNCSLSINYKGTSASSINLTTRANVYGSTDGSSYSSNAAAGTVTVSGYYMSGYSSTSTRSAVSSTSSTAYASTTLAPGSTATFKATPADGYEFVGWSTSSSASNVVSTSTTYAYAYDISYTAKTVYALFKVSSKTVDISAGDGGSVDPSGSQTVSSSGLVVTPTPDTDYAFAGWELSSGVTATDNGDGTYTITATADGTATATFVKDTFNVTIGTYGNGTVSPSASQKVGPDGLSVTATPNAGYVFDSWVISGDGVSVSSTTSATTTITATADGGYVTAKFKPYYTASLTVNDDSMGSADLSAAAQMFPGDTYTVTIEAFEGFHLASITVNGEDVTAQVANGSYTGTVGSENIEIEVNFAEDEAGVLNITNNYNANYGSVKIFSEDLGEYVTTSIEEGLVFNLEIEPNDGYYVENVEVTMDGVEEDEFLLDPDTYMYFALGNITINVTFAEITHTVYILTDGGGSVTGNTTVQVGEVNGASGSLILTPEENYIFDYWEVPDGVEFTYNEDGTYSINATNGGRIYAHFKKDGAYLNLGTVGDGIELIAYNNTTGEIVENGGWVELGDEIIVTANILGDGEYALAYWTCSYADIDEDELTYTFTVTADYRDADKGIFVSATSKLTYLPTWVEQPSGGTGYAYFHTIGDDLKSSEAWTVVEAVGSQDTTISVGAYSSSSSYQVVLPESAKNSDGTYTVYNARQISTLTFVDANGTKYTVPSGETAKVPTNLTGMILGESSTTCKLTIYTTTAEDTVYINTNDSSKYSGTNEAKYTSKYSDTNVANLAELLTALSLDDTYDYKDEAEVKGATFTVVGDDGTVYVSEQSKKIKGRGNTTWSGTNKKSWNINLDNKRSIDGMAKNKKWSLLANYQDPSLSRNRFLYDLADSVGVRYATDSRYVELYVNGLYVGSYLLTEKYDNIENCSDVEDDLITNVEYDDAGEIVSCEVNEEIFENNEVSFMIELAVEDKDMDEIMYYPSNGSGYTNLSLPDPGDVADFDADYGLNLQETLGEYIIEKYDELYNLITDPTTTYEELSAVADIDSLAKTYLIQELGKNYDSGVSSFYLCYEDGKFYAAPVWDFDNTLGNANDTASRKTADWWCETWTGTATDGSTYTGNFVNAMSKNTYVMMAARNAWFGTAPDDTTSFLYNLNYFDTATVSDAKELGANTGIQPRAYYESIMATSQACNSLHWSVAPNNWSQGHTSLAIYSLGTNYSNIEDVLNTVDFDTYYLPDVTLSSATQSYTSGLAASTSSAKDEFDYASDYMMSRANWLTAQFADTGSYYFVNSAIGWGTTVQDYPFEEIEPGIYKTEIAMPVDTTLNHSFKIVDAITSSYIGSVTEVDLQFGYDEESNTYVTNNAFACASGSGALKTTSGDTPWDMVNVYYQPAENKVWVDGYELYDVVVDAPTDYVDVTVTNNATGEAQTLNYSTGDEYTVTVAIKADYADMFTLESVTLDGEDVTLTDGAFTGTIGEADSTVKVKLLENTYNVTINYNNTLGSIQDSDGNDVASGSTIAIGAMIGEKLTITPIDSYEFDITSSDTVEVTDNGDGTYTVKASADGTVNVDFHKYRLPVVFNAGAGVTITAVDAAGNSIASGDNVEAGTVVTVSYELAEGASFAGWTATATDEDENDSTFTFTVDKANAENDTITVTADSTISAVETSYFEEYLYFHTIGDDCTNTEAWAVMECTYGQNTINGVIKVGNYISNANYQYNVFLPENALNSDGTYTVFNNYTEGMRFYLADGSSIVVEAGELAKIPSTVVAACKSAHNIKCTLNIYTSNAEDSVYINTNENSVYSGTDEATYTGKYSDTNVANVTELITALSLDNTFDYKDKAEVSKATFTVVDDEGVVQTSQQSKKIKGRGNTTWNGTLKKSWNVNLNDKVSVDGMAKNKKYSLLANYQDPSLSRNRFLYDLADSVGVKYATDSRFVDLYVNGLYVGEYQLTEKYDTLEDVQDAEDLLDITPATTDEETGEVTTPASATVKEDLIDQTGDYSFMIELAYESQGDDLEWTPLNGSGILNLSLPDPGDVSDLEADYSLDGALESAITSYISVKYHELYELVTSEETTYEELSAIANVESLAKTLLIQEVGKNYDAGWSSFYLTYEEDTDGVYRFFAAPVWDFDNSLGNPDTSSSYISSAVTDDYSEASGWWCKYWYGANTAYTGNFVNAMANNDMIMQVAKQAWYGTGINDTSSFIYNINTIFDSTSTNNTTDKKNSGIQSRAYYESVIISSAAMNSVKWSVIGNEAWTGTHTQNSMYQIDYETLYSDIDMSTYNLPYWYAETQSYTTHFYEEYVFTADTLNGGEFDFAADWLISRCAWISYHLAAPQAYYLVGGTGGIYIWSKDSKELMLTEVEVGSGIYVARSVPIENVFTAGTVPGTGSFFKITNTETYLGPDGGTDIALTTATSEEDMYKSRPTAYSTNVIAQAKDSGAYYISDENYAALGGEDCTAVNIYLDPTEMRVWVTAAVEDLYTAPVVSIDSNAADNKVEDGSTVTLTATATGITAAIDGEEEYKDYVGLITYDFYEMTGEHTDPTTDTLVGSVRTSSTTASLTFQPSNTATYYVVAYPTNDSSASGLATILIYYGKEAKEFEADIYFDFNGATVPDGVTPELVTIDDTNTETSYELAELGDSNIYTSNVTVDYYESVTGNLFSNFGVHKLIIGDIVIGITNDCQPDINKLIDSKTLWLKSTDSTLESNMIDLSFSYDDGITYTDTINAVKTTTNIDDSTYTTNRIYFTNNKSWDNIHVHYWNDSGSVGSTWPGVAMTWYGTNEYGQGLYYANIPLSTQKVIFNNGNNGLQTSTITLESNFSTTNNNAYYISGGSDKAHTAGIWSETTPVITSYSSNVVIAKGQTTSIKPVSNVDTIHYGSSVKATLSYSGTYFDVAEDGTLTAKAVGSETINIEPRYYYGTNWLPGITTHPVTITVVDADALNTAIANAEVIIAQQEANDTYTTLTYNTLLDAYNAGINVLDNLTTQAAIDEATATIKYAIDNMRTNPTSKAFDLISYHTAVAKVTVNNAELGTVTEPDFGYVQTITDGVLYTVTYAAADGTADFKYDLTSTGVPVNADLYECSSWTMGEGIVSDNAELEVTTAPEADCTFTANFIMTGYRAVKLTYKFQDYDTSDGNYVYDESKETLDASYSTQAIIEEELVTDSSENRAYLETVITDTDGDDTTMFVPSIKSNYFDYSLDMDKLNTEYVVDEETGEITEVIIELQNDAHIYTVTINGTAVQCYYQETLYVEASDFGVSGEAVWYDQNNEDVILAVGESYEFHVVIDNMLLGCKANDDGTSMDGKAVVTNSYYELSYNNGTQKLTQNFYIVDYYTGVAYDDNGNVIAGATNVQFLGGGVVYYSMSNATASAYLTGADVAKEFIIDKITAKSATYSTSINVTTDSTTKVGYRYLTLADGGDIYRYSDTLEAYQYIFNLTFTNTSSNANKDVALYSYYVYSYELNGETQYQVSVSDTYAVASMYEAS